MPILTLNARRVSISNSAHTLKKTYCFTVSHQIVVFCQNSKTVEIHLCEYNTGNFEQMTRSQTITAKEGRFGFLQMTIIVMTHKFLLTGIQFNADKSWMNDRCTKLKSCKLTTTLAICNENEK